MRQIRLPILAFALGCAFQSSAEAPSAEGKALFEQHCSACHGADGKGDGPAAASLKTQPADLTRITARRNGVWPVLEIMSIIDGYTKVTNTREDMPVISELSSGSTVDFDTGNGLATSASASLVALADFLETIQSPKPERYVP